MARKAATGATTRATAASASTTTAAATTPTTTTTATTMPSSAGSRAGRTHRGLTCANCRARKTRCDGTQPVCKTCEVYQDECRYERPPPMSQIVAMARRLQEAEQTVAELRKELAGRTAAAEAAAAAAAQAAAAPPPRQSVSPRRHTDGDGAASPVHPAASQTDTAVDRADGTTELQASLPSRSLSSLPQSPSADLLLDLSVDSNGKLLYVGPTSAMHNPPAPETPSPIQTYDGAGAASAKSDVRTLLTAMARESRAWEEVALGTAALQTGIPRAALARLLQIYWTYLAPMFMWLYRPAFMRDMASGGPYYSPLLLVTICSQAARFRDWAEVGAGADPADPANSDSGAGPGAGAGADSADPLLPPRRSSTASDALMARARLLLGAEIHRPSAIPTMQALLQLSARDLAFGRISQAWLFSGMAFRMADDLGLQHSSSGRLRSLGHLNAEDMEIRRRLYWSCYFWDKVISLYLGRMPALVDLPFDSSPELLDDVAEHELWTPFHVGDDTPHYPPMKAHAISCFVNSSRLSIILCDVILQLYSCRRGPDVDGRVVQGIRARLDAWRAQTPPHLICDPSRVDEVCCPPHILTQNLLYYTTIILLHRPFYAHPAHHAICRRAADQLAALLLRLERTFGFSRLTYLMAYCVYTGASVVVPDVQRGGGHGGGGDPAAAATVDTFLRALRHSVVSCPLVQRSLDIITAGLERGSQAGATMPAATAAAAAAATAAAASAVPPIDPSPLSTTVPPTVSSASAGANPLSSMSNPPLFTYNYLPAFPCRDSQVDLCTAATAGSSSSEAAHVGGPFDHINGGSTSASGNNNTTTAAAAAAAAAATAGYNAAMDLDGYSLLDCFPEHRLDGATAEWYMPQ